MLLLAIVRIFIKGYQLLSIHDIMALLLVEIDKQPGPNRCTVADWHGWIEGSSEITVEVHTLRKEKKNRYAPTTTCITTAVISSNLCFRFIEIEESPGCFHLHLPYKIMPPSC